MTTTIRRHLRIRLSSDIDKLRWVGLRGQRATREMSAELTHHTSPPWWLFHTLERLRWRCGDSVGGAAITESRAAVRREPLGRRVTTRGTSKEPSPPGKVSPRGPAGSTELCICRRSSDRPRLVIECRARSLQTRPVGRLPWRIATTWAVTVVEHEIRDCLTRT